jgi:hypothetical protein
MNYTTSNIINLTDEQRAAFASQMEAAYDFGRGSYKPSILIGLEGTGAMDRKI